MGRKPREPIPTGPEAEEELRRIRRNERRAKRRAIKSGTADPETVAENNGPIPAAAKTGKLPTAEELKLQFQEAFEEMGGTAGLVSWGRRYPKEFYAIWARMNIPRAAMDGAPGEGAGIEDMLRQLDQGTGTVQ